MFACSVFTYAVLHDILFRISGRENRRTTGRERWYHAEELHICDVIVGSANLAKTTIQSDNCLLWRIEQEENNA